MIVLDTGVLFAATDRRDAHHSTSAALLDSRADDVVILPVHVLVETAWLVQRRLGARVEAGLIAAAAAGDFPRGADPHRRPPQHAEAFVLHP